MLSENFPRFLSDPETNNKGLHKRIAKAYEWHYGDVLHTGAYISALS